MSAAASRQMSRSIMTKQKNKIPVEVYSRVVGYFRPVAQWNPGKQEEYKERKDFTPIEVMNAVNDGKRVSTS